MNADSGRVALATACAQRWDVLIVGGGISGAGLLLEAARQGRRALLIEQGDFASGTSSRSSKLVHGGLRYLRSGQFRTTFHSVRERERLMQAAAGLVWPVRFMLPQYAGARPSRMLMRLGLTIYDALAGRRDHLWHTAAAVQGAVPTLRTDGLLGAFEYGDAATDDARLVLRVLHEARQLGAQAFNYVRMTDLLRDAGGRVCGLNCIDQMNGATARLSAETVLCATGAWGVDTPPVPLPPLRRLRGSHLLFPAARLPLPAAIGWLHPLDARPVFAYPWEGVTLVGTTDVDQGAPGQDEPCMSAAERDYLLAALAAQFPAARLEATDALSAYAGVRAVHDTGQADPSRETREQIVSRAPGWRYLAGGKLTTFRLQAQALLAGLGRMRRTRTQQLWAQDASTCSPPAGVSAAAWQRLRGRYGTALSALVAQAAPHDWCAVAGTPTLWAELVYAARHEAVQHLDDLLLRRTRLGLLLPEGGAALFEALRQRCQPLLGWNDVRWQDEVTRYVQRWQAAYRVPN